MSTGISPPKRGCLVENEIQEKSNHVSAESKIDPLLCRFCGSEMKIISFITEYPIIKKILTHINFESQQPEPLAHSPPLFKETVYVPF